MSDENVKIIDTSNIVEKPVEEGNLFENRKKINQRYMGDFEITIFIQAYNRLEKTKACIDSVMKYTADFKFKLLLVDNGSDDGTFEYFKEIKFSPKKIIRLTENKGSVLANDIGFKECDTKYVAAITNDVVVTKDWLDNMLKCAESDERIGQVNPVVTNSSNYYLEALPEINTLEEAEKYGIAHNHSDGRLWAERFRNPSLCYLLRKEAIEAAGGVDVGFYHEFLEDDFQIRMRRAGYKVVLAEDTFVHHNHYMQERDMQKAMRSTEGGHRNYLEKHRGIEPWSDMDNYIYPYIKNIECCKECPKILGIDTRCGQPILDMKNRYRRDGIEVNETDIFAYTNDAKYYDMLRTITSNVVSNQGNDALLSYYKTNSFDAIVIGEVINMYDNPVKFLGNVLGLLKKGGTLVVSLYNVYDFHALFASTIDPMWRNRNGYVQLHYNDILEKLDLEKAERVEVYNTFHMVTGELQDIILKVNNMIRELEADPEEIYQRLLTEKYWFCVKK